MSRVRYKPSKSVLWTGSHRNLTALSPCLEAKQQERHYHLVVRLACYRLAATSSRLSRSQPGSSSDFFVLLITA